MSYYERVEERRGFKFLRRRNGSTMSFSDARSDADRAHSALNTAMRRCFKLLRDPTGDEDLDGYDEQTLEWFLDSLEEDLAAYRVGLAKRRRERARGDRIRALRDTTGRTPEEAELYRAKADELERRETT